MDLSEADTRVMDEHLDYAVGGWEEYNVPFLFTTNGRKYIEEIKEKSGVHFLDCRKKQTTPKYYKTGTHHKTY